MPTKVPAIALRQYTGERLDPHIALRHDIACELRSRGVIDDTSVGQIVLHINNGGVTKICWNNWEIK